MAQRLDLQRLEVTGEPIRVAEEIDQLGMSASFATSASGTLAYWSGARIITQPTWFQRDGSSAGTLGTPAEYMNLALSFDGRQVALDRFDPPDMDPRCRARQRDQASLADCTNRAGLVARLDGFVSRRR